MSEFVFCEKLLDDAECDTIVDFFKRNKRYAQLKTYKDNQNVHCHELSLEVEDHKPDQRRELASINNMLNRKIEAFLQKRMAHVLASESLTHAGFSVREILGDTKPHVDGVHPCKVLRKGDRVALRVCSVILTLSDNDDAISFPLLASSEKTYALEKGSILAFPPYWMYPHSTFRKPRVGMEIDTSNGNRKRYSIQTWILENVPLHS